MKKIDRLILSAAAGAAVLIYVTRPRGRSAVPTTAANRLAQIRADAFRATLGRELSTSPEFWA